MDLVSGSAAGTRQGICARDSRSALSFTITVCTLSALYLAMPSGSSSSSSSSNRGHSRLDAAPMCLQDTAYNAKARVSTFPATSAECGHQAAAIQQQEAAAGMSGAAMMASASSAGAPVLPGIDIPV